MNIKKIYDTNSFLQQANVAKQFKDNGLIIAESLIKTLSELAKQETPELTFLAQTGIQIDNTGGYLDAIRKLKISADGDFGIRGKNNNQNNKISLNAEASSIRTYSIEAKSDFDDAEVERASFANINILGELMLAHNEKYKNKIDEAGYIGIGDNKGLFETDDFMQETASKTFANSTGDEIKDVLLELINAQRGAVYHSSSFVANKLVASSTIVDIIKQSYVTSQGGGQITVADELRKFYGIELVSTFRAGNKLAIFSNSTKAMNFRINMPLQISNLYKLGFKNHFESRAMYAGLDISEKNTGAILAGV